MGFILTNPLGLTDSQVGSEAGKIAGYYGLLAPFYFGGVATDTVIDDTDVDNYVDVNLVVHQDGLFDYRPEVMKEAQVAGHTGAGTVVDPFYFPLEGLTENSWLQFRCSATFDPDIDESQIDIRLLFERNSTSNLGDFEIAQTGITMTQGADIEYALEPLLSAFVGDTIATVGTGDAGRFKFQIKSSVEGTLHLRALTAYYYSS